MTRGAVHTNGPSPTLKLAMDLIERRSVTPEDAGCQQVLGRRLTALGFTVEHLRFGMVDNLWARRGKSGPLFAFAGHTDVVPAGPLDDWRFDPFKATLDDGFLFGRGAADMKSSVAAMVTAVERFCAGYPKHDGSIAFLITSDEEGVATDGTVKVMEHLGERGEGIDWCLVGEPSSETLLGDVIKVGRRGSLSATLKVKGVQGHVAYPQLAANPIHLASPVLAELSRTVWDQGNEQFPPTSLQCSNIHGGTGVENVIPGELEVMFNFRYCTESEPQDLKGRVLEILDRHGLDYQIDWRHSGVPFLTASGRLLDAVQAAILTVTGRKTSPSTAGGTSDGRFIAPTGSEVVELGPVNATIHKVDERVSVSDSDTLSAVYEEVLVNLLAG